MKKQVNIGTDPTTAIAKILTRFEFPSDLEVKEWVESLSNSDMKDSGYITKKYHRVLDKGKTEIDQPLLPSKIKALIDYTTVKKQIPIDEQRAYILHVIKPNETLRNLSKPGKDETNDERTTRMRLYREEQNKEIRIDQSQFIVSDRFVFIGGSREFVGLEVVDISKMKILSNLAPGQQLMERINVPCTRNEILHLEMQSAVSMRICFDNKTSYIRPERKGFRSGVHVDKNPMSRFIVILDIVAPASKVKNVLMQKIDMVDQIVDSKPDSKEAKMVKSFKDEMTKKATEENTKENTSIFIDDEEVPDLITCGKSTLDEVNNELEEEDEGIIVPDEALDAL